MRDEAVAVVVGSESADFLRMEIDPSAQARDWAEVRLRFRTAGIEGGVRGELLGGELGAFRDQLALLQKSLRGEARLAAIEGWLNLEVSGDGVGHIRVVVTVRELFQPSESCLQFTLHLDQTQLAPIIRSLDLLDVQR